MGKLKEYCFGNKSFHEYEDDLYLDDDYHYSKWKKKKKSSTISRYKIDEKKGGHDTWLKEHDDFLKDQIKRKKEKEGWDQLLAKGGSVTNQRRLAKRGWGATKRK